MRFIVPIYVTAGGRIAVEAENGNEAIGKVEKLLGNGDIPLSVLSVITAEVSDSEPPHTGTEPDDFEDFGI